MHKHKSLLQFTKSFPISREEWPHWQQCSTDLTISSPPPPMCKCFVIKEQLHSAFTVLDGGCCSSLSIFFMSLPPSLPCPKPSPNPPPPILALYYFSVDVEIVSARRRSFSEWDCVWASEGERERASVRRDCLCENETECLPACLRELEAAVVRVWDLCSRPPGAAWTVFTSVSLAV